VIDVAIETAEARQPVRGVGIDLGLKDFITLSTGEKVEAQRIYRDAEQALAMAQRAGKKRRVSAIQSQIANRRNDFQHKLSHRLVHEFDYIAVGNVNAAGLAKTNLAKSVLDAGWSSFRCKLAYKAVKHGAWFEEVNESFTTQTCSSCGTLPDSRPKGIAGLGIREWQCSHCGCVHDRDTNAALNILRRGRATLAVGIPVL
jgi:putative transposase